MKNNDEIIEFINEENDDYYTDDSMFNICKLENQTD